MTNWTWARGAYKSRSPSVWQSAMHILNIASYKK